MNPHEDQHHAEEHADAGKRGVGETEEHLPRGKRDGHSGENVIR